MSKGPENKTVLEGNDVTLFCEVGGAPMPNVTWYRDGKLINKIKIQIKCTPNELNY